MKYHKILKKLKKNGIYASQITDLIDYKDFEIIKNEIMEKVLGNDIDSLGKNFVRGGSDAGMVECYIDWSNLSQSSQLIAKKIEEFCILISETYRPGSNKLLSKLYINKGITSTRGYHSDGQKKQLKTFIFLTDVTKKDGPYNFVSGSHKLSIKRFISFWFNRIFNSKIDANTYLFNVTGKSYTGNAGMMVISDQNGLHRGTVQEPEGFRVAIVIDSTHI